MPRLPKTPQTSHENQERLIRIADVCFFTSLGRSTVYAKVRDGTFPKPVKTHGSSTAWKKTEVDSWIHSREVSLGRSPTSQLKKPSSTKGKRCLK